MSVRRSISRFFARAFQFSGTASRGEYWHIFIALVILSFPLSVVDGKLDLNVSVIIGMILLVPFISLTVRRLHDIGLSGLFALIGLIPFFGQISLLILMALPKSSSGVDSAEESP